MRPNGSDVRTLVPEGGFQNRADWGSQADPPAIAVRGAARGRPGPRSRRHELATTDAFCAVVAAVSDRLYALAFRYWRDAGSADDALQECLVTIWRHLPELRDDERFDAWVRRILVNACRTEARRTRRVTSRVRALRDEDADAFVTVDPSFEERDALEHELRG